MLMITTNGRRALPAICVAFVTLLAAPASAQSRGIVDGVITDLESGTPIEGAIVTVIALTGDTVHTDVTETDGRFRITGLAIGQYTIMIRALGYQHRTVEHVDVTGSVTLGQVQLLQAAHRLNAVVVTASRAAESVLDAPASVQTVSAADVRARPTTSVVGHLGALAGVDIVTIGLTQSSVVARGFNDVSSGSLFEMVDYRWAAVPSLRINTYNLLAVVGDDIERIELVLGPGSALYGPNVDRGVMHILTRSPLDHQGTSATITAGLRGSQQGERSPLGGRDLYQFSMRHAGMLGERVGYKISGIIFQGDDWRSVDVAELVARDVAIQAGASPDTLRIGDRDFSTGRYAVDGRVDVRTDRDGVLSFSGGVAHLNSSIELTPIGAAQGRNWTYTYGQARYRRGEFFAQAYVNHSNAGESFLLRDGGRIVDKSVLLVGQAQHGVAVGDRLRLRYGADVIRTVPRTEGTISGAFENDDDLLEIGGYVQTEVEVLPRMSFITAGRVDHHNRVDGVVFSPRAALVVKPSAFHSFRLTYNRAFSQPSAQNLFLDLPSSPTLGPFEAFGVRATGVPYRTGFHFRRDCGGLCMYSPFAANPEQPEGLDVAPYWQNAVDQLDAVTRQVSGTGLEPGVEGLLRGLDPTGQVGTVLRKLDVSTSAFGAVLDPATAVRDINPLVPSVTNTLEFGFKGFLPPRLYLSVDVYATRYQDFLAPLAIETPNAFLDPSDLDAFLRPTLEANGMTPSEAGQLIGTLATMPLGTVTPAEVTGNPTDLYVTVRNFGRVDLWGADVAAGWPITNDLLVSATYSYVSRNYFRDVDDIADVALNAPRHKGSLSLRYQTPRRGFAAEARGRYINGFDVRSGVFVGTIEAYTLVDLNVNYSFPFVSGMDLTVAASNLFDNRHREIIGAPEIGRTVYFSIGQVF